MSAALIPRLWLGVLVLALLPAMAGAQAPYVKLEQRLSAEQDRRLDVIEGRFAARRPALEAEVRAANRELAEAIAASKGDSAEVRAAVDHFHDAMGALQKATIAHVFEMRSVLTPDQAQVFDKEIAGALTQESR